MKRRLQSDVFCWVCLLGLLAVLRSAYAIPPGFVYLDEYLPSLKFDLRYATTHNFTGQVVTGYEDVRPVLTKEAADALVGVINDLKPYGLTLLVFDAYRPQRAVDHFVRWAEDKADQATKADY